eukprot:11195997-Lingulodinium_polyedra.AAC.1
MRPRRGEPRPGRCPIRLGAAGSPYWLPSKTRKELWRQCSWRCCAPTTLRRRAERLASRGGGQTFGG